MVDILHQLIGTAVYPKFSYRVFYIPGGCLGFLPSTVGFPSSEFEIPKLNQRSCRWRIPPNCLDLVVRFLTLNKPPHRNRKLSKICMKIRDSPIFEARVDGVVRKEDPMAKKKRLGHRNSDGGIILPTQQCTIQGKSFKITTDLHCLNLPKWVI